jgi:hypothetical protein
MHCLTCGKDWPDSEPETLHTESKPLVEALKEIIDHTQPPFITEKWTKHIHEVAVSALAAFNPSRDSGKEG